MHKSEHAVSEILKALNEIPQNGRTVIAIDGLCGSGKTTVAEKLAVALNAPVIHTDDFFLPLQLRTSERLAEPGGNIHYERFVEDVISKIALNNEFSYRVFDCSVMRYGEIRKVPPSDAVIVEGSYSMHPRFVSAYTLKVFLEIDKDEQKRRIIQREGADRYSVFETKWIPMEEIYFSSLRVKENCDKVIKNCRSS